jgi:hypothetical protein
MTVFGRHDGGWAAPPVSESGAELVVFAFVAMLVGGAWVLLGNRWRKLAPEDRRYPVPWLPTGIMRQHPQLARAVGLTAVAIGVVVLLLVGLVRLGVIDRHLGG